MKRKVLTVLVIAFCLMTACGKKETDGPIIQDILPETPSEETTVPETPDEKEPEEEPEVIPEHSYRSELTNEWIDESLRDQRPIAVMVDNEKTALPHYGLTEADVVYEIMNSTKNDRVTRFMAIVKDWGSITQFGSVRSARPTNVYLAGEWNAVLCHDGGPFYIDDWIARDYTNNLNGGFARFSNGKAWEFTEYLTYDSYTNPSTGKTYDGLKERFEKSKYSTSYNEFYLGPHFKFADSPFNFDSDPHAVDATTIVLPFKHNQSMLRYNEDTKTYDYYEYGQAHLDPLHDDAPLTFKNVILQNTYFVQLDENGYLIYDGINTNKMSGYYITEGKAIPVVWEKPSEKSKTVYYNGYTGEEIELNTGKIYISLVPSDSWDKVELK